MARRKSTAGRRAASSKTPAVRPLRNRRPGRGPDPDAQRRKQPGRRAKPSIPFTLLSLPGEIRNLIYSHLIPDTTKLVRRVHPTEEDSPTEKDYPRGVALGLVSKQLRHELGGYCLRHQHVHIDLADMDAYLCEFYPTNEPSKERHGQLTVIVPEPKGHSKRIPLNLLNLIRLLKDSPATFHARIVCEHHEHRYLSGFLDQVFITNADTRDLSVQPWLLDWLSASFISTLLCIYMEVPVSHWRTDRLHVEWTWSGKVPSSPVFEETPWMRWCQIISCDPRRDMTNSRRIAMDGARYRFAL